MYQLIELSIVKIFSFFSLFFFKLIFSPFVQNLPSYLTARRLIISIDSRRESIWWRTSKAMNVKFQKKKSERNIFLFLNWSRINWHNLISAVVTFSIKNSERLRIRRRISSSSSSSSNKKRAFKLWTPLRSYTRFIYMQYVH